MVKNLVLGSGATFLVSFASLVLIARLFPLNFISDVKAITVYGGWFSVVLTCQVHSAFLFFHNRPGVASQSTKSFVLGFLFLMSALCTMIFYFVFPYLHSAIGISRGGLLAFSFFTGFNLLFTVSPAIYTAQASSARLPFLMFFYPVSALVALLSAYLFDLNVNHYAMIAALLAFTVLVFSEWRSYAAYVLFHGRPFFKGYTPKLAGYSGKISLSMFFEALGDRVDKVLASRFLAQSVFAKYSVVCFENPIVGVLLNSYGLALVKKFQGGVLEHEEAFLREWEKMVRVITFFVFPVSIFLLFNHKWFISTVFGERFVEAGLVFQVYLLVSLFRFAPFQALLRLEGLVQFNVIMAVSFFLSSVAVGSAVVWGGAPWKLMALSYLAGWISFNGLAVFFFCSRTRVRALRILTPRIWAARVVQCFMAGLLGFLVSPGNPLVRLACFILCYLLTVFFFDPTLRQIFLAHARPYWRRP